MALNLITAPTPVAPAGLADYVAQNNLLEAGFLNTELPLRVISGNIPESAVLHVAGAIYRADADTAIGPTGATDYVKITPAGATASADYVADLTGVTWHADYSGYYDVGGNLYIFDEGKAVNAGEIATVFGRFLMQESNGDVNIGGDLSVPLVKSSNSNIFSVSGPTQFTDAIDGPYSPVSIRTRQIAFYTFNSGTLRIHIDGLWINSAGTVTHKISVDINGSEDDFYEKVTAAPGSTSDVFNFDIIIVPGDKIEIFSLATGGTGYTRPEDVYLLTDLPFDTNIGELLNLSGFEMLITQFNTNNSFYIDAIP